MSLGAFADPPPPLSDRAFDGGLRSAESLGRGLTYVSSTGNPASGSENPAALLFAGPNGMYSTVSIGETTDVSRDVLNSVDPLENRTIQYLSVYETKGTLFYEPLGRLDSHEILNPASPLTDFRDVEFNADAIGFAGAQMFGKRLAGGLSLAYLRGSLATFERRTGMPDQINLDNGNGVRLNVGLQVFTGRASWGLVLQNFPGFLWWRDHQRSLLPVTVRLGNTWRLSEGTNYSIEIERRYYNEGGNDDGLVFSGLETSPSSYLKLYGGIYSSHIEDPEDRHYTGGITIQLPNDMTVTYALDRYRMERKGVTRSFLSVRLKFIADEIQPTPRS